MTFLDNHLNDRDRRDLALLREFRSRVATNGPGTSDEVREHVASTEQRIGNHLHANVSTIVNADPNLSSLADEMVRGTVRHA